MPRLGTQKLYPILKPRFQQLHIKCGRDRLYQILREHCLLIGKKKRYTKTTNSLHRFRKFINLIKNNKFNAPEQLWVSDITYIRTKQGFMFLSLITDAYSKKIMGYNIDNHMRTESCLKALNMALKNRIYSNANIIHHSDRGIQYCSPAYTQKLLQNGFKISMTENGDPYENAIAERVNGILKNEFSLDATFESEQHATREVKKSIEIYNLFRPHFTCQLKTPNQAHQNPDFNPKAWSKNSLLL